MAKEKAVKCPDTLFKYVGSTSAAQSMLNGSIKFAQISELNDPMDTLPWFDGDAVTKSLEELRREKVTEWHVKDLKRQEALLQKIAPEFQVFPAPNTIAEFEAAIERSVYQDMFVMQRYLEAVGQAIRTRVGVLSLTVKPDSHVMWAHYANQGQGACIAMSGLSKVFAGDETGILNVPLPVKYSEERQTITFRTESDKEIFLSKHADWSYESE